MPADTRALSPVDIDRISLAIRDGTADPADARRLMSYFCECVDSRKRVPQQLLDHFASAFRAILDGYRFTGRNPRPADFVGIPPDPKDDPKNWAKVNTEQALGLCHGRYKREDDGGKQIKIAAEVLRHMLDGKGYEQAVNETASQGVPDGDGKAVFYCSESIARAAWSAHKQGAVMWLLRLRRNSQLTSLEEKRLRKIFRKETAQSADIFSEALAGRWVTPKKSSD